MTKKKIEALNDDDRESRADSEALLSSSDPEAKQLYDLAIQVRRLAPWQWMEETDLFGVVNPETGELGFVSIMGNIGEYEAVAVYPGAEGLYDFMDFQADEYAIPQQLLERPHIQVEFSSREYLEKEDRDLIKRLGLKFKGSRAWPIFRSYRPGYMPWFVTRAEAVTLIQALTQVLDVATRVRDDPNPIRPVGRVDPGGHWVRAARREGTEFVWEDQVWNIERPKRESLKITFDNDLLERLKRTTQSDLDLEVDLLLTPGRVGEPGQRPLALYVLMVCDSNNGFILGVEPLTAEKSLPEMHAAIPNALLTVVLQNRIMPKRLLVRSEVLRGLLRTLTQSLNIELRRVDQLPSIDEAAAAMMQSMFGKKP
jgi:hypothetical protein